MLIKTIVLTATLALSTQAFALDYNFIKSSVNKIANAALELTNDEKVENNKNYGQNYANGNKLNANYSTDRPRNFSDSKKIMYGDIYKSSENHKTIYCGCDLERQGKRVVPNLDSCGYKIRKESNRFRAERIEAEHIVPASLIGLQNKCMIENKKMKDKRNFCEKNDPEFKKAYVDLHNLAPAVGEVNLDRSNYPFREIQTSNVIYGSKCNIMIDTKGRKAMPPPEAKGEVARAYLYMSDRYDIRLSDSDRKTYQAWNRQNTPTHWEFEKNKRIRKIQGNSNPYVQNLD